MIPAKASMINNNSAFPPVHSLAYSAACMRISQNNSPRVAAALLGRIRARTIGYGPVEQSSVDVIDARLGVDGVL